MLTAPPAMERLSLTVQAQIRSTQILTSLPQILSELLLNALDAGATKIDMGVNCAEWSCWVQDNGCGLHKNDLEAMGTGVDGGRYRTSKIYAPREHENATFGFRGEALASAANLCCLEICSRTAKSQDTWSVILKGNERLYFGPAVRWKRESHGTCVSIRDAFYNVPVRRKSHPSTSRTWELIRREIETYSLVFPHVSFSLEDSGRSTSFTGQPERPFRVSSCASSVIAFKRLFGAAYTEHIYEVDATREPLRIRGFISLAGASSKSYQFLYVNRHPISTCDLHRTIDNQFASSSFAKNGLDDSGETMLPRSTIRRSPRKIEKKPVYLLDISAPSEDIDNCLDPNKSIVHLRNTDTVMSFLSTVIEDFLRQNGFSQAMPEVTMRSADPTPTSSPRKRRRIDSESFNDSGYVESPLGEEPSEQFPPPQLTNPSSESIEPYATPDEESTVMQWTDHNTGQRFLLDSRTGTSILQNGYDSGDGFRATFQHERRRTLGNHVPNSLAKADVTMGQQAVPSWLEQALESNKAYSSNECNIRALDALPGRISTPREAIPFAHPGSSTTVGSTPQLSLHEMGKRLGKEASSYQFTRPDLRRAQILDQVDRKFVACRLTIAHGTSEEVSDDSASTILFLIDQHAADERIRVERFLKEICSGFLSSFGESSKNLSNTDLEPVSVMELDPPRPVLLTRHEALTLNRSQDIKRFLRCWGIRFAEPLHDRVDVLLSDFGTGRDSQLLVCSIPDIVSEKLLQGDELRDLIKGILGQIQTGDLRPDSTLDSSPEQEEDTFMWLKAVRYCPRGLLELINSKACRGAIMFNDTLTKAQCSKLVEQLSETAFPFQCAHGRPSLVPIFETGTAQRRPEEGRFVRKSSGKEWRRLESMALP